MSLLENQYANIKMEMETAKERRDALKQRLTAIRGNQVPLKKKSNKRAYFHLQGEPHPVIYGFHYWKRQQTLTNRPMILVYSNDIRRIGYGGYTNEWGWFYRLA